MTDVTAESVAQEISDLLKSIAGPRREGETVPQQQARVARALRRTGISERRLWSLWYRPRDVTVRAHEADNIRAVAADLLAKRNQIEEMERENAELRRRLAERDRVEDTELRAGDDARGGGADPGRVAGPGGFCVV